MARVAGAVQDRHDAAHRMAEDDRPDDAQGVAEGAHVVRAQLEAPVGRVVSCRPAVVTRSR